MLMNLNHPVSNLLKSCEVKTNSEGEYTKIIFDDGFIVTDESYIYDILFDAGEISVEQYDNKFWYIEN